MSPESLRSENYYQLLEAVDAILWEADSNLVFSFVSPQVERILGFTPQEWAADPQFWENHLHPEDRSRVIDYCVEETKQLRSHSLEYRMIAADGREIWFKDMVTVEPRPGRAAKLRGILVDITALKIASLKLCESEERFRNLAEAAMEGVIIHQRGEIKLANEAAAHMFGFHPTEMLGKNILALTAPESRDLVREKSTSGYEVVYEAVGLRSNGEKFWCELRGKETVYLGCAMRVTTLRDVTNQKNWEAQKERTIAQEQKARKEAERSIAVRDEFLAIASHELKTPLTPLQMTVQLMKLHLAEMKIPSSPRYDQLVRSLNQGEADLQHLARLIEDLLNVSRISAGRLVTNLRRCNFSEIVAAAVLRLGPEITKSKSVTTTEITPNVWGVWDSSRLEQVVTNLLTNALKYGAGRPVKVSLRVENQDAVLEVKDGGIGISPADQQRIFDRFERVVPVENFGGLGLGLYIVQQIVVCHGGTVTVESSVGEGALFRVRLPLESPGEPAS